MGLRLGILVASLAANAVLGFLIFRPASSPPLAPAIESARPSAPDRLVARSRPKEATSPAATADGATPLPAPAFDWSQLESQDYKEYIARLRAFGVPDRVISEIIIADVNKLYRPKLAALRPPPQTRTNFWEQSGGVNSPRQPKEQREQSRLVQREKQDLIKELLGKDVYQRMAADAGQPDSFERLYGSAVLPEQRDKVSEIQERYQRMKSDIYEENEYNVDEVAREQIRTIQRKLREELATVLSSEQIENYELRTSDVASNMRYELRSFEPNEEEFRAIFKYKQAKEELDALRNADYTGGRPSSEDAKLRREKQKEMDEALSQALNPDRTKEFKLGENYEYRNLLESGVDKDSVFKLADMQGDVQAAAAKLRQDKALSDEQRKAALAAIRAETEKSMVDLLGERRARGYLGNGGYWLRNIAPKP
ncbi:MAG TPA: hypothetical protein VJS43_01790 [Candidatus Acidoferrales bacterium]|nr:hypothetical protein [Candidatus Acidoferrales bacterium]